MIVEIVDFDIKFGVNQTLSVFCYSYSVLRALSFVDDGFGVAAFVAVVRKSKNPFADPCPSVLLHNSHFAIRAHIALYSREILVRRVAPSIIRRRAQPLVNSAV